MSKLLIALSLLLSTGAIADTDTSLIETKNTNAVQTAIADTALFEPFCFMRAGDMQCMIHCGTSVTYEKASINPARVAELKELAKCGKHIQTGAAGAVGEIGVEATK